MKRRSPVFGSIALILASATAFAADAPSPAIVSGIEAAMDRYAIPGASVAVIRDYEILWARGFGLADKASGRAVETGTLFQAASISKPLTAVAIMIASGEKGFDVGDGVNVVLARFPPADRAETWSLPGDDLATPVTIAMLLAHIGGTSDFHYSGYRYGYDLDPPHPIDPIPTMIEALTGTPPANTPAIAVVRKPGVTWVYSPAGYTIIQAALTNIYGKPFPQIMEDLVLRPLEMTDSAFAQPPAPSLWPRVAIPYLPDGSPLPDGPRVFDASASGGLTTTPSDLAKFVIAMQRALAGEADRPITPEIARRMMERQPGRTLPDKCFPADGGGFACETSWGLGFDVNLDRSFEHVADGEPTGAYFGHSGFNSGYLSLMLGSKEGGNGVVVMVNVAPEDMSGGAPQFDFLTTVAKLVADAEDWK